MRTKKRHQNSIQVLFFLLLSVLVLTYSCKKMDYFDVAKVNITERFFELPKNADPILKRIVEDLKQKNNAEDIVKQIMAFEKEMYYSSDSTVIYHIKTTGFDNWPADTTKPQDFYISLKFTPDICSEYYLY
ncbi:MAG: hypothetical protein IPI36_02535 [Chitinophagaceae bacterium]|nr:hypothetical protein [Chitinophagaceae bacterium]